MFIQHATGHFQVAVGGKWHCGPDNSSPKQLAYEIKIEYPDSALDSHGFLLDNLEFQKYFDSIQYTEDSCELMAWRAADHFFQMASNSACKVHADIKVPGLADIEYEEETKPVAPPPPMLKHYLGRRRLRGEVG